MNENNNIEKIIDQLSKQEEELNSILKTISIFVDTYKSVKVSMDKLNIPNEYNFVEDLKTIKNNLDEIKTGFSVNKQESNTINENFKEINQKILKLENHLEQINTKYNNIISEQDKITKFVISLENLMATIDNLNLVNQEEKINKYCDKVDSLAISIKNNLSPNLLESNKKIEQLKLTVDTLLDDKINQQKSIDTIAKEFVSISNSLEKISQKANIDKAVLFALFDEWQESKKGSKNKK